IIAAAIVLNSCRLSTSFSLLSSSTTRSSRNHFFFIFANSQQHQLQRSSTSLFFSTAAIYHLDDSNMKDLLFSPPPDSPSAVLVDAYTQWCGPCKLIEPLLQNLHTTSPKYSSNQLSILKYDVEGSNHQNLKVELLLQGVRVSGLPTLMLFWRGQVVATHSGVISKEGLEDWLDGNFDVVATMRKNEEEVKKGEKEEEDVTASKKRGFISFASQYGMDDYAISSY
ncbi:hypothetical protein ACHAWT_006043, partial [Skeletonema menzelii]